MSRFDADQYYVPHYAGNTLAALSPFVVGAAAAYDYMTGSAQRRPRSPSLIAAAPPTKRARPASQPPAVFRLRSSPYRRFALRSRGVRRRFRRRTNRRVGRRSYYRRYR